MANLTTAWTRTDPSFVEPGVIMQFQQASGCWDTLAGGKPMVKIGSEDLFVYVRRFDIRTTMASGQAAYNLLPSVNIIPNVISTPTYLNRVRAEYDHHDTAAFSGWGSSIVDAQRLGMRQGHFQLIRNDLLYGKNPANYEGLLNATGTTAVPLPADSNNNTTIVTYDNGQMAQFLLQQIVNAKSRMMQLGLPQRVIILGPQRVLGYWEYNVVELVAYQRAGAGSASIAGQVKDVAAWNEDTVEWVYDDTLIGKGVAASGNATDAILIVIPEVKKPAGTPINTNEFALLEPGLEGTVLQYMDVAAPIEIPTPIPGGAIDVLSELRDTCGWPVRPEAVTIVSAQFQ
jgi:hypothetical protein